MAINQPSTISAHGSEGQLPELDVLTLIMRDHLLVEQLLNDYQRCGEEHQKRLLVARIIQALKQHEACEEAAFWPRVREVDASLVSRRLEEEAEAKRMIGGIEAAEPGAEYDRRLHALIAAVLQHAVAEEQQVFPRVRDAFHSAELLRMGQAFEAAKRG